ncbi:hypothetical protein, variant [Capsaspora owczarzaki ATCC 30864]|uniref:RED-like N-terminal domain-containing protein n=1 Tax=Capsaspora owczarzaki (strain ATCC 30864) TaxID=595528 RepID=A0A0D2WYG1_CAPO3|nr:hypothetical protein, variant [Capsaspora owczarzaki ATCC 30864]
MSNQDGNTLSNSDFRKLLMTPRTTSGLTSRSSTTAATTTTTTAKSATTGAAGSSDDGPTSNPFMPPAPVKPGSTGGQTPAQPGQTGRHHQNPQRAAQRAAAAAASASSEPKYRDRAEERRKGINPDFKASEALMNSYQARLEQLTESVHNDEERRRLEIEQSKFLGGDAKHTHLVRGLDFALLKKEQASIEQANSGVLHAEKQTSVAAVAGATSTKLAPKQLQQPLPTSFTATAPSAVADGVQPMELNEGNSLLGQDDDDHDDDDDDKAPKFHSKLARNIHETLFGNSRPMYNDLFLPGRMAFVCDLTSDYLSGDVPTSAIRSKADLSASTLQLMEHKVGNTEIIINKLVQMMTVRREERALQKTTTASKKEKGSKAHHSSAPEPAFPTPAFPMHTALPKEGDKAPSIHAPAVSPSLSRATPAATATATQETGTSADNADDDIFADVGEYVPRVAEPHGNEATVTPMDVDKRPASYFSSTTSAAITTTTSQQASSSSASSGPTVNSERASLQVALDALKPELQQAAQSQKQFAGERKLTMSLTSQNEDEYYPRRFHRVKELDGSKDALDGDEEESSYDRVMKNMANPTHTLTRFDFDNEEEWLAHTGESR